MVTLNYSWLYVERKVGRKTHTIYELIYINKVGRKTHTISELIYINKLILFPHHLYYFHYCSSLFPVSKDAKYKSEIFFSTEPRLDQHGFTIKVSDILDIHLFLVMLL